MRFLNLASVFFLLAVFTSTALAEPGPYDPTRDPAKDVGDAVAAANKANKRVLLEIGRSTCGWTRALDQLMSTDQPIADVLAAHYVLVRVNRSSDNPNAAFLSRLPNVPGVPHLFVLGKDGKVLVSQGTDIFEQGKGHDPAKLLAFLLKWAE